MCELTFSAKCKCVRVCVSSTVSVIQYIYKLEPVCICASHHYNAGLEEQGPHLVQTKVAM